MKSVHGNGLWGLFKLGCLLLMLAAPVAVGGCGGDPTERLVEGIESGAIRTIDLGYPLNERNPHWPGPGTYPFRYEAIATLDRDGFHSGGYRTPEHLGTHLDAPNHFEAGRLSVDRLAVHQLIGPGALIRIREKTAPNADYVLTLEDVRQAEQSDGPIPRGAVVILETGWGARWGEPARYANRGPEGRLHFPGFGDEAVDYLIREREIRGIGIDTMSIDTGNSDTFPVHHRIGRRDRFALENLNSLDALPLRGFVLIVAPIRIEGGSGGQARVWALVSDRHAP